MTAGLLPSRSLRTTQQEFLGLTASGWAPGDAGDSVDPGDYHVVYRMFAAPGIPVTKPGTNLLYVGMSGDPTRRINQHAATKNWFPHVRTIVFSEYQTRAAAAVAEATIIWAEMPAENLTEPGRPDMRRGATPRAVATYLLALVAPNMWHLAAQWDDWSFRA
jgi:hypothetical protein